MISQEKMLEKASIAIMGHERACVRWAQAVRPDDQTRIYHEQVEPSRAAIMSVIQSILSGEKE